jgi:hypothetical protein
MDVEDPGAGGAGGTDGRREGTGTENPEGEGVDGSTRAVASLDCAACGYALGCPVTLTTLSHPAVVSFFHDHGVDLRERSIWNVGPEWGERVVSTDPLAVRVSATLDGETLALYLGRDLTVVHTDRADGDDADDAAGSRPGLEAADGERDVEADPGRTTANSDSDHESGSVTA